MAKTPVLVVMASYNAGQWLAPQLDSLAAQDYQHWRLLVSDDGSLDQTVSEIQVRCANDTRIELLPRRKGQPGHVANFEYLLQQASAVDCEAIFLCDQDDIWDAEKISTQLAYIRQGAQAVCSDVSVVTEGGTVRGGFWQVMKLSPDIKLKDHLAQNAVVGCSLALTPKLLELALPFPPGLQNHDWWLALCAMAIDGFEVHSKPLLKYRQHSRNSIGVGGIRGNWSRRAAIVSRQRRNIDSKIVAVNALIDRLSESGRPVPSELKQFSTAFSGRSRLGYARALLGSFRPQRTSLLIVQLLSLLR